MMRSKKVPSVLYKYYPTDRRDFFTHLKVRFSQIAVLNDPFEFLISVTPGEIGRSAASIANKLTGPFSLMKIGFSGSISSLKKEKFQNLPVISKIIFSIIAVPLSVMFLLLVGPFLRSHLKALMKAAGNDIEESMDVIRSKLFLVFSCSESWQSVPMWAHYASNHEGFCIGINSEKAFNRANLSSKSSYNLPVKVDYVKSVPKIDRTKLNFRDILSKKMDHWSYEREWRYISVPDDSDERGEIVNGHELMLFHLNPESVEEVIFGANCSSDFVKQVICDLKVSGINPKIYQVKRNLKFGFDRSEIESLEDLSNVHLHNGHLDEIGPDIFNNSIKVLDEMESAARSHNLLKHFIK